MDTKLDIDCDWNANCTSPSSPGSSIAFPIAFSLVGILGNAIALVTVHQMKLEQHRTVFFVFVAGLAWADLIGIIVNTVPVLIVYMRGHFVGGSWMCTYHAVTMITFGLLTPMIVCAMALERYFGIRHGYFYMCHFNATRARLTLLSLWLAAILFASLPFFGFGQYAIQYPGTWCFLSLHPENNVDAAYSVTFAVLNLFLIGTMIICNIVVQCTLGTLRCQRSSADRPDQFRRTHRNQQQEELEVKMMFVLLAITVVFTVSWAPLQFRVLLNQFYEHQTAADHVGDLLVVRLASFNQLLDPWVYILCKKICFRKACTCCRYLIHRNRWTSFQRNHSNPESNFHQSSSIRSIFNHIRNQSTRLRHLPTWRHKELTAIAMENAAVPGTNSDLVVEVNVALDDPTPLDVTAVTGVQSSSATPLTVDLFTSNDVPIPIFSSSQYSISIQRRVYHPHWMNPECQRSQSIFQPMRTNQSRHDQTDTTQANHVFTFESDCGEENQPEWKPMMTRRRHSWCCSSDIGTKRYVTQSTQTRENRQPLLNKPEEG